MGADYWSLAVAGHVRDTVEGAVSSWLLRKGFEEVPAGELALEIDEEIERGFFLVWDERWTIVLYSHLQEMERLQLELAGLERPVLGLWLHDSDIWGYELVVENEVVSAFHSNPRYFGREEPARGPNDREALAKATGVDAATIRRLQAGRAVFKERVCEAFARGLGIGPAASQYAYRLDGEIGPGDEGFQAIHRRFRRHDRARLEGFDLHAIRARSAAAHTPSRPHGPDWSAVARAVGPGHLLVLRSLLAFLRLVFLVVRPAAWLVGWGGRLPWRVRRGTGRSPAPSSGAGARTRGQRTVEGFLVDPTGRFRVRLAEPAIPLDPPIAVRGMAFRVDNLDVHGSRIHGRTALGALERGWGTLLYEEDFRIGDLPAKAVGWRREGGEQAGTDSHCIYVQTPC